MTSLRQALADYLAMRRAMGYRLARAEKLLGIHLPGRHEPEMSLEAAVSEARRGLV